VHALYSDPGVGNGELSVSLARLRQSRRYSDPFGESTGVPLETSRAHTRWETRAEWVGEGWSRDDVLTVGGAWILEEIKAAEYGDPERESLAAWARDEWYASDGLVTVVAARLDAIDGEETFSPRAGLRYPLSEQWIARSNLGLDFRPPSFEELYRNEGLVVGNSELNPERTLSFDIGLGYTSDRLRMEVGYFNLQTRDLIDYLLISGFRWKPYNIGRARSSGFEATGYWVFRPGLELRASYTRTRAVDTSGDPLRHGRPLVGRPSSETFCELKWRDAPWEAFLNWQRQGSSPLTPSGTRSLPAYDLMGAGVGYDLGDGMTLVLEGKNIFDETLTDVRGFPLPGRSWFLTLSGEW
jgi:iron complex outermembrane receptor protein